MLYTGIDLTEIDRIRRAARNPRFVTRVFSAEEQAYFAGQKDPAPSMAAWFAAKEAFSKARGTGVRRFKLAVGSVVHDAFGAPRLRLSGAAAPRAEERGILELSLSLTHTDALAAAVVVAIGRPGLQEGV